MTIQDDWKKELHSMKLSQTQKERVIQHMYTSPKQRVNWAYRLVLPAFIILTFFAIILTLQPSSSSQKQAGTTTATEAVQTLNGAIYTEMLFWLIVVIVLTVLAFIQFVLLVFRFKRWQENPITIEIQALLRTHMEMWIVHLAAFLLLLLTFGFWFGIPLFLFDALDAIHPVFSIEIPVFISICIATSYLLYIHVHALKRLQQKGAWLRAFKWQFISIAIVFLIMNMLISLIFVHHTMMYIHSYFAILLFINQSFLQLWGIRNNERVACPCCGEPFTLRQILKKSGLRFNEKCDYCQETIYLDTQKNRKVNAGVFFIVPSALLMASLGIATSIWSCFILFQALFIWFVTLRYSMHFTKEKQDEKNIPPLW